MHFDDSLKTHFPEKGFCFTWFIVLTSWKMHSLYLRLNGEGEEGKKTTSCPPALLSIIAIPPVNWGRNVVQVWRGLCSPGCLDEPFLKLTATVNAVDSDKSEISSKCCRTVQEDNRLSKKPHNNCNGKTPEEYTHPFLLSLHCSYWIKLFKRNENISTANATAAFSPWRTLMQMDFSHTKAE